MKLETAQVEMEKFLPSSKMMVLPTMNKKHTHTHTRAALQMKPKKILN